MNSTAGQLKKLAISKGVQKNTGRRRSYNIVSEEKIAKMMEVKYQARTEVKIKWAVNCYNEWRDMHLDRVDYEDEIFQSDLKFPSQLTKKALEFAMCRFICEVKKTKEEGDYPGKTLYQMVCAIQNYLRKHKIDWKLIYGSDFSDFSRVLDNVMQERAANNIGTTVKQAQVISLNFENMLWEKNILGEALQIN